MNPDNPSNPSNPAALSLAPRASFRRPLAALLLSASALADPLALEAAAAPAVVVSIKPVHSLVAMVMEGVADPVLLVRGNASPHTYALRPSDAAALQSADLVFWTGEGMELFLAGALETLAPRARSIPLMDTEGLLILPQRSGGAFEAHDHDHDHAGHDHDQDHADHAHDHEHDHAHDHSGHDHDHHDHEHGHDHEHDHAHDHADHDHDHDAHDHDHDHSDHDHDHDHDHAHDHAPGAPDLHLWLDPANAALMLGAIEEALSAADPGNAEAYAANAARARAELESLSAGLAADLAPLAGRPFVVFHDAYQYFEHRFGLEAAGSITVSPDVMPGAQRIAELRALLSGLEAACVFAEPQFEPAIVSAILEGTEARAGVLDPEGGLLPEGPGLYSALLAGLADGLLACLAPAD